MAGGYGTPGDADVIEALGRVVWNFLYLEETAVAVLHELELGTSLSVFRALEAGPKASRLRRHAEGIPAELREQFGEAVDAFDAARAQHRNVVFHGHPYTASYADDGAPLSGLRHTRRDETEHGVAETADDLHAIAREIEAAMYQLTALRGRVGAT